MVEVGPRHRRSLGGYNWPLIDAALHMLVSALLVAYLIYTTEDAVMTRLGTTHLYVTAPFVVAGLLRYQQIVLVEEAARRADHADPRGPVPDRQHPRMAWHLPPAALRLILPSPRSRP